jgi:type I restriction enzyme R subunit
MSGFTESVVEEATLEWLGGLGWEVRHGPELEVVEPRGDDVVLRDRLRAALGRLNPDLPHEALDDAFRKLLAVEAPTLVERNRAVHRLLVDGVNVEFRHADGSIRGAQARVLDFDDPRGNDWLAVNQVAVVEGRRARRPDVVLFVNGLPLAVIELKNAADEDATVHTALAQLETYQAELPSLFAPNVALVASDGIEARIVRSAPARSGSSRGARSRGTSTRRRRCPSSRYCSRARSSSGGSSTSSGTSSCSRTRARGSSRSSPATTSSTR